MAFDKNKTKKTKQSKTKTKYVSGSSFKTAMHDAFCCFFVCLFVSPLIHTYSVYQEQETIHTKPMPWEGDFPFSEKVYFRSQILERPTIGEYRNISGVPVLPENVIFTFFRTCWCYSEAYNTGTQK